MVFHMLTEYLHVFELPVKKIILRNIFKIILYKESIFREFTAIFKEVKILAEKKIHIWQFFRL